MGEKSDSELLAEYLSDERDAPERLLEVARRMLRRCAEDLVTASVVIESADPGSPQVHRLQVLAAEVEAMTEQG